MRLVSAVLLAGFLVSLVAGEPPGKADKPADKKALTPLTFPPDTVVAVYDNLDDVLKKMPRAVVLTPEKYQELLDEIARLRKQLDRPRLRTPSKCLLKGKVDGGLVLLQAQFEFVTDKANEVVRLGCGLGQATGITLDGRTPQLLARGRTASGKVRDSDEEGFTVRVETAGEHQLTLDLVLALSGRPAGQGFALDLPRAAITRLELDLPPGASEVRLAGKPLGETLLTSNGKQVTGNLGASDRLDLAWKSAQAISATAVLAAEGTIHARIDNAAVSAEARLTLRVLAGQTKTWTLMLPAKAEVKLAGTDEGRATIKTTDLKDWSSCVITLKEPTADPLNVTVTTKQPGPKPGGKPTHLGPFTVLGTVRQNGTFLVSNSVVDWHLKFTPNGDLARRDATEEESRQSPGLVAVFHYGPGGGVPGLPGKGGAAPVPPRPGPGAFSWLDLEVENARGQIKTRSAHLLRLMTEGAASHWQMQTTITVTPHYMDVGRFTVLIPPGCEIEEPVGDPLPERVMSASYDKASRLVEFKLFRGGVERDVKSFPVTIAGVYSAEVNPTREGRVSLGLPTPQGTIEQDGLVTVQVPPSVELLPDLEPPAGMDLGPQKTHELVWRCPRRGPQRVEVAWRPYHPPVRVASLVDVTLAGREGRVRQELKYQLPPNPGLPAVRLVLRVPAGVLGLRVVKGGEQVSGSLVPPALPLGGWQILHLRPSDLRQPAVVLEYSFALPGVAALKKSDHRFAVPLVVPDVNIRTETQVRIWSEGGDLPGAPSEGWSEHNIQEVPGRTHLPVLVLQSSKAGAPLTLRSGEGGAGLTVLIERALVRVEIGEAGVQTYRASYRVSRLAARHLDFEFPAPVPTINLVASLNGKRIDPELIPSEGDRKGRRVRLRMSPDLVRKPALLELSYQLPPDRTDSTPIRTTLLAPQFVDDPGSIPTRWQIVTPPWWVVVAPEAGPGAAHVWGWRGWLAAPRSRQTGADLERWLIGGEPSASVIEATSGVTPSLVLWRDGNATVQLLHAPQQAWLLTCSLLLVLFGLMLSRLSYTAPAADAGGKGATGPRPWAWLLLAVVVVLLVLGVLLWPSLAGQVAYGCQPGAAVLLLLALVQWLLHERYRRQLVFLPSFSRARPGSSLGQKEPARQLPGEPSTVDVPLRSGSSVNR